MKQIHYPLQRTEKLKWNVILQGFIIVPGIRYVVSVIVITVFPRKYDLAGQSVLMHLLEETLI